MPTADPGAFLPCAAGDTYSAAAVDWLVAAASTALKAFVCSCAPRVCSAQDAALPPPHSPCLHQERHGPFRLVVGGDLLYRPPTVQPLLGVLDAVCGARTHVLLAASLQHSPETMRLFAEAARGRGFEGRILPAGEQHPSYASGEVRILHLSRRQHPR